MSATRDCSLKTGQLFKGVLLAATGLILLAACAKPPVAELTETRRIVAHAYASGASELAPEAYALADKALRSAESQVEEKRYKEALTSLALARNYTNKALNLTIKRKQQLEEERQKQLAEERRREERRQKELEQQRRQLEEERKQVEEKKPMPLPAKKVPPKPKLLTEVEVGPTDNLLLIAARPEVYNDGMLWPLIYKANRDQIKNPKEIFPGQKLVIPRDKNSEEIDAARQEAMELNLF